MKLLKTSFHLHCVCVLAMSASAAINIQTSFVGDAGNANDGTGYGEVGYGYHIGTHEVTNSQYTAFLNAVAATDPHSLYNSNMSSSTHGGINQSGTSGSFSYSVKSGFENKPVNYVSFWDAARFTNWLTSGETENGVYVLTPAGIVNNTVTRDNATWNAGGVAIASENEWYKAAYYNGSGGYFDYPTQSNSITTAEANYNNSVGTVTDVGSYSSDASYYGTFDQGGNVWEWNDKILFTSFRGRRGGSFGFDASGLQSSGRFVGTPTFEGNTVGFRVSSLEPIGASLPEPEISFPPKLEFETADGQEYSILASDSVDGNYTEIGTLTGDGSRKTFVDLRELASKQFYKIEVLP